MLRTAACSSTGSCLKPYTRKKKIKKNIYLQRVIYRAKTGENVPPRKNYCFASPQALCCEQVTCSTGSSLTSYTSRRKIVKTHLLQRTRSTARTTNGTQNVAALVSTRAAEMALRGNGRLRFELDAARKKFVTRTISLSGHCPPSKNFRAEKLNGLFEQLFSSIIGHANRLPNTHTLENGTLLRDFVVFGLHCCEMDKVASESSTTHKSYVACISFYTRFCP